MRVMKMTLSSKIEHAKNTANALANYHGADQKNYIWQHSFYEDLKKIINDDLMQNNPDILFKEYKEYFKAKDLPIKTINPETVFYRGRIGNELIHGAEDDYNRCFVLPYYQHEIEAPPPIYTEGGRFNRQGISYLYLADTIDTCLAEIHLQIGQNCSIGEFRCTKPIDMIDLTKFRDDLEMETWLKILTQPIHNGIKHL